MTQADLFGEGLRDARERVMRERWGKGGTVCPCCDQLAKVYNRPFGASRARALIGFCIYSRWSSEWRTIQHFLAISHARKFRYSNMGGEFAKMALWGLVEEKPKSPEKDTRTSGVWKVTDLGLRFAEGRATIQERVILYNNGFIRFDGPEVTIQRCMGGQTKFSYEEVMRAVAEEAA